MCFVSDHFHIMLIFVDVPDTIVYTLQMVIILTQQQYNNMTTHDMSCITFNANTEKLQRFQESHN